MSRYLSVDLTFEGQPKLTQLIAPLFSSEFFEPVAIGGGDESSTLHSFLAGYALEDFMPFFAKVRIPRTRRKIVKIASEEGSDEYHYLSNLSKLINEYVNYPATSDSLSPFEVMDPTVGITYLNSKKLNVSVLEELDEWLNTNPYMTLIIYGSIDVAVTNAWVLPWERAFRFYWKSEDQLETWETPTPILPVRVSRHHVGPESTSVSLQTTSRIWLQHDAAWDNQGLKALMGKEEADQNLAGLASLVGAITGSTDVKPDVEYHTEGSLFSAEHERIRQALFDVLGYYPSRS